MLAVDTNVVVRFLTGDDPEQYVRAVSLFREHTIWLPKTVMLETEWVLRSAFGFTDREIAAALNGLVRLPAVRCEDGTAIRTALDALSAGMDFADALHVASSRAVGADEGFVSFDRQLVKHARKRWPDEKIFFP